MASGQSQGLQVALIVSIVLVVILAVTTFFGFDSASEARRAESEAKKLAGDADTLRQTRERELREMAARVGIDLPDVGTEQDAPDADTVIGRMKKQIGLHGDAADKTYNGVMAHLESSIASLTENIRQLETKNRQLQDALDKRTAETAAQIAQATSARDAAMADRDTFIQTFTKQLEEERNQVQSLTQERDQIRLARNQLQKDMEVQRDELTDQIGNMQTRIEILQDRVKELEFVDLEQPDGKIRAVDRRIKSVYINLGKADFLPRQIGFSVYPRDAITVGTAKPKAKIEVVRILEGEEHMAEARITSEELHNPIERGDLIYNPGWSPGTQSRFALAGWYLIDEDNNSDRDVIKSLVKTFNGAVYDAENPLEGTCEVVEGTGQILGEINHMTTFLVLGDPPTLGENAGEGEEAAGRAAEIQAERDSINTIVAQARQYGVRVVPYKHFLETVGYTSQRRLFQAGSGKPYSLRYGSRGAAVQGASNYDRFSPGRVSALFVPGFRAKMLPRSRTRVSGLYMPEHAGSFSRGRVSGAAYGDQISQDDQPAPAAAATSNTDQGAAGGNGADAER